MTCRLSLGAGREIRSDSQNAHRFVDTGQLPGRHADGVARDYRR
jgi:hypothetical protein